NLAEVEAGDYFTVSATATFNGATSVGSNQITVTGHGYSTGDTTVYSDGGGTTVVGLASGTTYYIIRVDANTVKLAITPELAAAGTAITLADGVGAAHTLSFDFGAKVSYIESATVMYLDSSKGDIFSARAYKTPNYRFDHAKDCILARCYHEAIIFPAKEAVSSSASLYIDYAGIVDDLVGSTLSFSGVSGTPTVVSMSDLSGSRALGTGTHLITMSSTQSISDEAEVTFSRFVTEPFTVLDSGDSLEDDDTPKLSGDLNVNGMDIVGDLIELKSETGGEEYIVCTLNGAVDLYHNDVKVLETTAAGITVTGAVTGDLTGNASGIDDADGDTSITTSEDHLTSGLDAIQFEVDGDTVMYLSNLGDASDGPLLNLVNNDGTIVADDVIGQIVFSGTDAGEQQYCSQIKCVSTTTHGAGVGTNASSKLEFYSRNGVNNTLGMYLNYNGELWAPVVYGNGIAYGSRDVYITSAGEMGYLSSIRESKANIQDLGTIDWLYNLSPVSFNYREYEKTDETFEVGEETHTKTVKNYLDTYSSEIEYGLIAEDVELVNTDFCEYDVDSEGNKTLVGVGYRKLITPMLKALKDQNKLIEDLTARIEALEGK
nr:tail fiber domain-containing protein [Gammaproteobacteria bacterium]